jgi:hypothetical protein
MTMKGDAKDYDIIKGLTELGECILEWGKYLLLGMIPISLSSWVCLLVTTK